MNFCKFFFLSQEVGSEDILGFELERKEGGFIVSSFVSELRALRSGEEK